MLCYHYMSCYIMDAIRHCQLWYQYRLCYVGRLCLSGYIVSYTMPVIITVCLSKAHASISHHCCARTGSYPALWQYHSWMPKAATNESLLNQCSCAHHSLPLRTSVYVQHCIRYSMPGEHRWHLRYCIHHSIVAIAYPYSTVHVIIQQ